MELPARGKGDELLPAGAMLALRERMKAHARRHDLASVAAYAFDRRTRMLPFYFVDRRMSPAGVRGIGSAFADAGFEKTRVVLQTWNRDFKPSRMRIDGRVPDLFMVSSMWIHSARMKELIADANRIDPALRPLVVAGGPHMWYSPWDVFGPDPAAPGPDVAVTGELYVLLEMLDRLLEERDPREPLRSAFLRLKARGGLDDVPGLVYPVGAEGGPPEALVDTGIQRLLGDLDELPDPVLGYGVLEAPSRGETLGANPLPASEVRRHSPIASIEMTYGCKFRCPYCPIPALNQHKHRGKSPARIADEMKRLHLAYGMKYFFGTDDNFFNSKSRSTAIVEALATTRFDDGVRLGKRCRWATEATVHDVLQMRDHLKRTREAGCRAIWMGVEDMTATLVKKGQSVDKTREAFRLLRDACIHPMPMLIHDDGQPLISFKNARGLLNQVQLLRNAGAMTVQVLSLGPAPGTKLHDESYRGLVFESVNGRPVEAYHTDGNHVFASFAKRPWAKQLNILFAYLFFYNPLRFLKALVFPKNRRGHMADASMQLIGMCGWIQNLRRTPRWLYHLMRGNIVRHSAPPVGSLPFRSVAGGRAPHALDGHAALDKDRRPARETCSERLDAVGLAGSPRS